MKENGIELLYKLLLLKHGSSFFFLLQRLSRRIDLIFNSSIFDLFIVYISK